MWPSLHKCPFSAFRAFYRVRQALSSRIRQTVHQLLNDSRPNSNSCRASCNSRLSFPPMDLWRTNHLCPNAFPPLDMFFKRIVIFIPPSQLYTTNETLACIPCILISWCWVVKETSGGKVCRVEMRVCGGIEWESRFGLCFGLCYFGE